MLYRKNKFFNKFISFVLCLMMIVSLSINAEAANAYWRRDGYGWWLEYQSGGYPYNTWLQVDGVWYYFSASGYIIQDGWIYSGGSWYYLSANGAMAANTWVKSGGKWYYLGASGAMAAGTWVSSGGRWYYLGSDGAMYVNTTTPDGYYVGSDGAWTNSSSGNSGSSVSTSNANILRAVEFADNLLAVETNASYGVPVYISWSSVDRIDNMLWVASVYGDSRLRSSGNYFVMNVEDAKSMINQVFGIVTQSDVSAMRVSGSDMYYDSVNFRGDAGPYRLQSPSSANIEGKELKITGSFYFSGSYAGTYTITLSKTDGGYFGGYSFDSLSTYYN